MKSLLNSYYLITRKKIPIYLKYYLAKKSEEGYLPKEYKQVEYIESTGTQYIDTGINPISSTRIDINFAYVVTTYGGWVPIFGARSIVNNVQEQYGVFIDDRNLKLTTNYSSRDVGGSSNVYIEANKKYNLKNNQGSFYINDILESSISVSDTLSNNTIYPVYLFDLCNYGTRLNRGTRMKLYSCKFYDGDTLIRNYIPCYRKSDNVIGLYDIVNNVFYTNAGTGEFIAGGYLPKEYKQVEYIESTGTQFIDTDYKPNSNSKIEIEYIPTEIYSEFMVIYGTQNSSTSERFYGLISSTPYYLQMNFSNSAIPNSWGFNKNGTVVTNQNGNFSSILQRAKVYVDNSSVRIESQEYSNTYNMTAYETWGKQVNCDYNLILFARNSGGIVSNNFIGKIYSCKIYDGDTLIRNYIPCYRKSDNVIGLYDIVNNVFYTNQGTGEFIAGGDV